MWQVQILESETMQVVDAVHPVKDVSIAEKIERGINANLNHNKYQTEIVYLGEDLSCLMM